jgi:hypothetical protein
MVNDRILPAGLKTFYGREEIGKNVGKKAWGIGMSFV